MSEPGTWILVEKNLDVRHGLENLQATKTWSFGRGFSYCEVLYQCSQTTVPDYSIWWHASVHGLKSLIPRDCWELLRVLGSELKPDSPFKGAKCVLVWGHNCRYGWGHWIFKPQVSGTFPQVRPVLETLLPIFSPPVGLCKSTDFSAANAGSELEPAEPLTTQQTPSNFKMAHSWGTKSIRRTPHSCQSLAVLPLCEHPSLFAASSWMRTSPKVSIRKNLPLSTWEILPLARTAAVWP